MKLTIDELARVAAMIEAGAIMVRAAEADMSPDDVPPLPASALLERRRVATVGLRR
jgi:hypothetical protein